MALAWPYTENFTLGPRKGHKCGTFIRIYVPRASLNFNGPLLACQCTEMDQNGAIYVPIVYRQCTEMELFMYQLCTNYVPELWTN